MSEVIEEVIGVKEVEESPDDMEVSDEIEESGYKTIPISNAKEKQPKFALCSEKDYEKLKGYTWRYKKGYIATNIEGRYMTMHKMVLGTSNDGLKIDHINGDKHDNRQENLRFATSSQNGQNRPKQEDASSKLYGVKFNKNAKKFETWVTVEKDRHYLGLFENEVEAAEIVDTYVVQNFYIDVEGTQVGRIGDGGRRPPQGHTQHLIQIGGRVGAHDQNPFASFCQRQTGCTGQGCLADTPLPGKEQISRFYVRQGHDLCPRISNNRTSGRNSRPPR